MESHRVNSIISGRSPPLHCTFTLITMCVFFPSILDIKFVGTPKQKQTSLVITRIQYFWTKSSRLRYSNNSIEKLS